VSRTTAPQQRDVFEQELAEHSDSREAAPSPLTTTRRGEQEAGRARSPAGCPRSTAWGRPVRLPARPRRSAIQVSAAELVVPTVKHGAAKCALFPTGPSRPAVRESTRGCPGQTGHWLCLPDTGLGQSSPQASANRRPRQNNQVLPNRHFALRHQPRPTTGPPVPTDERLSFAADQLTGPATAGSDGSVGQTELGLCFGSGFSVVQLFPQGRYDLPPLATSSSLRVRVRML
jgi:hypothetical protein